MKSIIILASLILLSACATVKPADPAQAVYEANGAFIAALDVANAYKALPVCGSIGATAVCSNPPTVARVTAAANCVASVLAVAQNKVRNISTAVQAKCSDPSMAISVQAVNSLDVNGIVALARQLVGTLTSLTASLQTK